jgi:DNA-directed RNA polymerase subunit RPC12/RpoP
MGLEQKRFRIVNEGFVCGHCGEAVPPASGTTPRNHCHRCLWSRHVDINPGDRMNKCQGLMEPIGIYTHSKKQYVILHRCTKCGERVKAKALINDKNTPDDFDVILELSANPIEEDSLPKN